MKSEIEKKTIERLRQFADYIEGNTSISDRFTCRKIVLNLRPETYTPELVREARDLLRVSQSLFAQYMGVDVGTVQKWEQGTRTPSDTACRLMDQIRSDPKHARAQLIKSVQTVIV